MTASVASQPRTLGELARAVGATVRGDPELSISGVNGLAEARPGEISFFTNPRYRDALAATRASAIIVREDAVRLLDGRSALVAADPYLAFAQVSTIFHPRPRFEPGVDPRAVIEEGAQVDPTATVMALAYVGRRARIGPGAVLFPGAYVGEDSVVGAESLLYPGVVVREQCTVGDRAILHPGVVIGADGFGFAFDAANLRHFKIPQAGVVEIEEDVEIGANSAVDRAALGSTRIGRGTKIDNLVQVGHNAQIGPLCILCGQVGIAGSAELGIGVVCGGQSGITGHLKVPDRTRVMAQSGVMGQLEEGGEVLGSPAIPARDWMRSHSAFVRGPETLKELRRMQKRIDELEAKLEKLANAAIR